MAPMMTQSDYNTSHDLRPFGSGELINQVI